jgi:hypothetical protein
VAPTSLNVKRGLVAAAKDVLAFLAAHSIPACIIGGLAVQRWGEPRATQDVDLTLLAPVGEEAGPIDLLLTRYTGRDAEPRAFALRHRVLKLATADGVPIDVSLGALGFEREVLDRASLWRLSSKIVLTVCSAEDLLVYKLIAARPRDLLDIEGIVRLRWQDLDVRRVRVRARQFAELLDRPDLLRPFEDALRRARAGR